MIVLKVLGGILLFVATAVVTVVALDVMMIGVFFVTEFLLGL